MLYFEGVRQIFSFPARVNETAARVVAGFVMAASLGILLTSTYWLLLPVAYGFWARVLTGPTLSPLALFATRVAAPRLGIDRSVPGPPKRFAQAMGAAMTTTAVVLALGFGEHAVADALLVATTVAAGLEAILAFCVGCQIFALLMRAGLVPDAVCAECADIGARSRATI